MACLTKIYLTIGLLATLPLLATLIHSKSLLNLIVFTIYAVLIFFYH